VQILIFTENEKAMAPDTDNGKSSQNQGANHEQESPQSGIGLPSASCCGFGFSRLNVGVLSVAKVLAL